jgi:thermitase
MRRLLPLLSAAAVLVATPGFAAGDPGFSNQWGVQLIGAPKAWEKGATGTQITVAVIDSGVDLAHEDLASKVAGGTNYVSPGAPPQDDNGHGSHVAGIIAAATNNGKGVVGVAPDARIMPIKIFDSSGAGAVDAATAIRYAVDNGAKVVNMSFDAVLQPLGSDDDFASAIEYAWSKNVICVVAAGNDFVLSSGFADEPALVVAASRRDDTKPDYSSGVGGAKWGMSAPGGGSTFDAQENDIYSTYWRRGRSNEYAYLAGTSMAAPHVSGAAAALLSLGLSPQQTVDRLLQTAKDIGAPGRDSTFGAGRLDLAKAAGVTSTGGGPASGGSGGSAPTAAPSGRRTTSSSAAASSRSGRAASTAVSPAPAQAGETPSVAGQSATPHPSARTFAAPKRPGGRAPSPALPIAAGAGALAMCAGGAWGLHRVLARRP